MDRAAEAEAVRAAVELADGRLRPAHPLYTGLMTAIGQQGVRHQVRDVYAKVVADDLGTHPFGGPAAKLLAEGSVDPQRVIDRFGLREGALLAELQRRLRLVTGDDAIRRALALLLDPVLGEYAWAWLEGGPASTLLAEHGVPGCLGTSARALEALGAVARLYGQAGPRPPEGEAVIEA